MGEWEKEIRSWQYITSFDHQTETYGGSIFKRVFLTYTNFVARAPPLLTFEFKTSKFQKVLDDETELSSDPEWRRTYCYIHYHCRGPGHRGYKRTLSGLLKSGSRERYLLEQDSDHGVTSYSDPDNQRLILLGMYSNMADDSLEESVVKQVMCKNLYSSLNMLTQSERELIIWVSVRTNGSGQCSEAVGCTRRICNLTWLRLRIEGIQGPRWIWFRTWWIAWAFLRRRLCQCWRFLKRIRRNMPSCWQSSKTVKMIAGYLTR